MHKLHSFDWGHLPSVYLVDTDIIHVIKWPSPSVIAYCKQSKTGRWKGLGMRLVYMHNLSQVSS